MVKSKMIGVVLRMEKKQAVLVKPKSRTITPLAISPAGNSHSMVAHC